MRAGLYSRDRPFVYLIISKGEVLPFGNIEGRSIYFDPKAFIWIMGKDRGSCKISALGGEYRA